ncbi:MAG: alanine dehydrogenase [Bdellovibrionota bacterium]
MIVGVPRERKTLEKRIAITPAGAKELVKNGHQVLIETKAGIGSSFPDSAFEEAGCKIVQTLAEVWNNCEMLVKVKEPHEEEYQYFREDLILFDYLHLASMPDVTEAMLNGKITGIAYELVQLEDRRLPLLEPMSEVAGKLSTLNGAYHLLSQNGGRGMLLGGVSGVEPANVAIIGAGISGFAACKIAVGMGANVKVLDISDKALSKLKSVFGSSAEGIMSNSSELEAVCKWADLLIGAVLVPGAAAPKIVTEEMVKSMKPGSVIVDISIDQGGCVETIKPTPLDNPTYVKHGVIHYGVCNMPAQSPMTSTQALTAATLPYVLELADKGLDALKNNPLRDALNTYKGKLTNKAVSEAVGVKYTPIAEALV